MSPAEALAEILNQHEALRAMMDDCDQLADELDAGGDSAAPLLQQVARLREAFEAHRRFEEQSLRPILGILDEVVLDRTVAHHVGEHHAMHGGLVAGPTAELRVAVATLRDHLETEEQYFRSSRVARDAAAPPMQKGTR